MKLFSGKINVGELTKDLLSKIDDSKLTDSEKADNARKAVDQALEFNKLTLDENTQRSKTRRNLAHVLVFNTLLIFWFCLAIMMLEIEIDTELVKPVLELANAFKLGWAFISVIGFYFGVHLLRTYQSKK